MWGTTPRRILVALGTEDATDVLDVAAAEARRRERDVHLLHVVPPTVPADRDSGHAVLAAARDRVRRVLPAGTALSTELCRGPVVPTLVQESARACLLVASRDLTVPGADPVERLAARSAAPVLVVPSGGAATGSTGVVTVGVDRADDSEHVLRAALEESHLRGATLRVVHVRDAGASRDDLLAAQIEASHTGLLAAWPSVDREVIVRDGDTATAILAGAAGSELLVVGRHEPWLPLLGRLGPTTTGVLEGSPCPVLVVDVHAQAMVALP